jgi:hypothetical protein
MALILYLTPPPKHENNGFVLLLPVSPHPYCKVERKKRVREEKTISGEKER